MHAAAVVALLCTVIAIVLAMVAGKLWWEVPALVAVASLAHWENFLHYINVPIARSLANRRYYMSYHRELFRIVAVLLLVMLFAWQRFDVGPGTFFSAIADTTGSATENAFYVQVLDTPDLSVTDDLRSLLPSAATSSLGSVTSFSGPAWAPQSRC